MLLIIQAKSLFYDSLRAVIRTTAVEGRHVGVVLNCKNFNEKIFFIKNMLFLTYLE